MVRVMDDVAVQKKLRLKYSAPASLAALPDELEEIRLFASYYQLNTDALLPNTEANLINRLSLYTQSPAAPPDGAEVPAIIEGAKTPETAAEQWINNIQNGIDFLADKADEPLSMPLLIQLHKILVLRTANAHEAGRLRVEGRNLFSFIEEGVLLPEHDELQMYLGGIFELLNDENIHPLIKACLFFYVFTAIQPFAHETETIAILSAHHLLTQHGLGLYGLLNLEKNIFFNAKYLLHTAHLFGEQNYLERLDTDLTGYLEVCVHRFRRHIQEVKETLIEVVKEEFEYSTLTPRQKNSVNFWLQKGFFLNKEKLKTLTPRQHDIMTLLARYGFLATKDLVPVFQLDRKTIQRDFNFLLELGLVEQRGAGRSLRYHLDFKIML